MIDAFMIDTHWVLGLRTPELTYFFSVFPYFVSGNFLTLFVAWGFWTFRQNKSFVYLGFLIWTVALINSTLKNLFQLPRPDVELHLINVYNTMGFPSGDVQLATVFWLVMFLSVKKSKFSYLLLLPIILIAMSRVYLGVHNVYDVLGGFLFGALIVYVFYKPMTQNMVSNWYDGKLASYWFVLLSMILIYVYFSYGVEPQAYNNIILSCSAGYLLGYGLSARSIKNNIDAGKFLHTWKNYLVIIISTLGIVGILLSIKVEAGLGLTVMSCLLILIKFFIISIITFLMAPKFIDRKR